MMKTKHFRILLAFIISMLLTSCGTTSNTIVSNGIDLSKYKYAVLGKDMDGDGELADVILQVENMITETNLEIVPSSKGIELVKQGFFVLYPNISAKSEKWDGGHTYITVTLYDYDTNRMLAVLKSSGIGLSIDDDQQLAMSSIKNELFKVFGEKQQKSSTKSYTDEWQ